jgi:hypothetical protein
MRRAALSVAALGTALGMPGGAEAQPVFNVYGDADYTLAREDTTEHAFSLPVLDFFFVHTVDRLKLLAEVVIETHEDNEVHVEADRAEVGYQAFEWLRLRVGRFHTAFGYYNDAYHHGTYFMVPIGRPLLADFEESGGLLPLHTIGIHADGRVALGSALRVQYDLDLVNGRGAEPLDITAAVDANRSKALNLRLRLEPGGPLDGLVVGGNLYLDDIPTSPARATPQMGERIFGAHAAYLEYGVHFISEFAAIHHEETESGTSHDTYLLLAEAGYTFGDFTPSVRYQMSELADSDPYFQETAGEGSARSFSVAVRYLTGEHVALKLHAGLTTFSAPLAARRLELVAQCAWAF